MREILNNISKEHLKKNGIYQIRLIDADDEFQARLVVRFDKEYMDTHIDGEVNIKLFLRTLQNYEAKVV